MSRLASCSSHNVTCSLHSHVAVVRLTASIGICSCTDTWRQRSAVRERDSSPARKADSVTICAAQVSVMGEECWQLKMAVEGQCTCLGWSAEAFWHTAIRLLAAQLTGNSQAPSLSQLCQPVLHASHGHLLLSDRAAAGVRALQGRLQARQRACQAALVLSSRRQRAAERSSRRKPSHEPRCMPLRHTAYRPACLPPIGARSQP